MKRTLFAAALAAIVLPALAATAPVSASPSSFVGTWTGPAGTRGITKLVISGSGSSYSIAAWGACSPSDCAFGTSPLSTFSTSVSDPSMTDDGGTANFNESFATRTMTINLLKNGSLQMDLFTKFTDNSGRANYEMKEVMRNAAGVSNNGGNGFHEDCIAYPNDQLSVRNLPGTGYQLVAGNIALQLLDTEADADDAKTIAANHHEQCFVGRDNHRSDRYEYIMEYWK